MHHGIVEGRGGSSNKELEFRSWHCGRQGGEVPKPLRYLKGALRYLKGASKASKVS